VARTITAHLPPVPGSLQIYGPGDFVAACPDEPEDHAAIATMPEPERTIASLAWHGDAKLARRGKTVLSLAAALGLSDEQVDALFIAAEALEV
jgi:hypothetical protein